MTLQTRHFFAEFFGTFVLVFCGTGAIVIDQVHNGAVTHAGIAITFGLAVAAMVYTFGHQSGAHLNPAVTLALWVVGRLPGKQVLPYILAQCAGGIAASRLLWALFPTATDLGATMPAGVPMQSFVLEIILTMILMAVILGFVTGPRDKGGMAGVVIGGVVAMEAMFGGPVSGASMNPARSLAPALVSGNYQHLWIYLSAPVIGALLAVGFFTVVTGASLLADSPLNRRSKARAVDVGKNE